MPIIGVGLYFTDPLSQDYEVSQIVTTLVKMNSLFTTKFLSTEQNKGNIGNLTVTEINREKISNYYNPNKIIYSPISSTCQIKIGNNQMNTIRFALSGSLNDSTKDNGGLELRDDFGLMWFCHVESIHYDPVGQIAELVVHKVRQCT